MAYALTIAIFDNNNKGSDNKSKNALTRKLKSKLKTEKGLATVMSLLAEHEQSNQAFASALNAVAPVAAGTASTAAAATPAPASSNVSVASTNMSTALSKVLPATSIKLASILKKNGSK